MIDQLLGKIFETTNFCNFDNFSNCKIVEMRHF